LSGGERFATISTKQRCHPVAAAFVRHLVFVPGQPHARPQFLEHGIDGAGALKLTG
jgi:hypothetical protein